MGSNATPGIFNGVNNSPSRSPLSEVPVHSTIPIIVPHTARKSTAALARLAYPTALPPAKRCAINHDAEIAEAASTL